MITAEIMSIYMEQTQTSIGYTVDTQMGFITVAKPNEAMNEYMNKADYAMCISNTDACNIVAKYGPSDEVKQFISSVMYSKAFRGWHITASVNGVDISVDMK